MQIPSATLLAIAVGILGSSWTSGVIASFSLISVPAVRMAAPSAQWPKQWAQLYSLGANTMPKVALTTALMYGYAAWSLHGQAGGSGVLCLYAAMLTIAIVPYTLLIMGKTNKALHGAADGISTPNASQTSILLDRWSLLNSGRALFPLIGTSLGLIGLIGELSQ